MFRRCPGCVPEAAARHHREVESAAPTGGEVEMTVMRRRQNEAPDGAVALSRGREVKRAMFVQEAETLAMMASLRCWLNYRQNSLTYIAPTTTPATPMSSATR